MHFEIDAVSGTGYLVQQVPSAARPLAGWQKTVTLAAPAALATAGWVMRSHVGLGQGKARMLPDTTEGNVLPDKAEGKLLSDKIEDPDALRSCNITWSTWRVVIALIVLGSCTARQRRKKICKDVDSHSGDTAAAKLTQVKMFRICTEQPDAEPEPALRSGTELSALSEASQLPDSAELFRIHTAEPTLECSDLRNSNTEVQGKEAFPRYGDQRVHDLFNISNAANAAGVEAALGTKDYASHIEAGAEVMAEEAMAGLAAIQQAVTALPVLLETASVMRDEHRAIGSTVQTAAYSHAPNAVAPTMAARSMTSVPGDFSPREFSRALTSDQPLPSRGPLSSWPVRARLKDSNMKLVGAPKERIREIVNQLEQKST